MAMTTASVSETYLRLKTYSFRSKKRRNRSWKGLFRRRSISWRWRCRLRKVWTKGVGSRPPFTSPSKIGWSSGGRGPVSVQKSAKRNQWDGPLSDSAIPISGRLQALSLMVSYNPDFLTPGTLSNLHTLTHHFHSPPSPLILANMPGPAPVRPLLCWHRCTYSRRDLMI